MGRHLIALILLSVGFSFAQKNKDHVPEYKEKGPTYSGYEQGKDLGKEKTSAPWRGEEPVKFSVAPRWKIVTTNLLIFRRRNSWGVLKKGALVHRKDRFFVKALNQDRLSG